MQELLTLQRAVEEDIAVQVPLLNRLQIVASTMRVAFSTKLR